MTAVDRAVLATLDALYAEHAADLLFTEVMARYPGPISDDALADLIEADGRYRMAQHLPVDLDRYLRAIPDLPNRPEPLDAAIDMAFRAFARTSRIDEPVVRSLIASHPELETAIREAAVLNRAVWETTQVQAAIAPAKPRSLPADFGPQMLSSTLQRYELTQLLGEGGFGVVYLAVDRQLSEADHQALVSIKVLPGGERAAWSRQRLADEATKARRINHPNVVRVIDRGVSSDDEDFIVYEFIEGGDLAKWARRRSTPIDPREAARLVSSVARGVHAAHMAGLIHCDLKPANIVMTAEDEPKVADFGIAVRPDETTAPMLGGVSASTPMGNLAFMSPEQHNMVPGALNIPTDVYALGGILFWLITGELPNGRTPEDVLRTHDPVHGRRSPPSLRSHRKGIDDEGEAVCRRAMAVDPHQRYSSAAAMADDLDAWIEHKPIPWMEPSLWHRLRLWVQRKPTAAVATIIITLLVLIGGAVLGRLNVRLRSEETKRLAVRQATAIIGQYLEKARDDGISTDLLPFIWLSEWMFGPDLLEEGINPTKLWAMRIDVVREVIRKAEAAGRGNSIEALQWETTLGFWLVNQGSYAEAEAILDANETKWRGLLTREDPWMQLLHGIRASAMIRRIAATAPEQRPPLDAKDFRAAAEVVQSLEQQIRDEAPDKPMHRQLVQTLRVLYGPQLLNQPERVPPPEKKDPRQLKAGSSSSPAPASKK